MKPSKVNPEGYWMACLGCGRETQAKYGYCYKCVPATLTGSKLHANTSYIREELGRPLNPYFKCYGK